MADIVTVNPDQLGEAAAPTDEMSAVVFAPGGPLQKLPFDKLLSKLISTNLCKASQADLVADLAYDADAVALVYNDPTALQNGWYRKTGASGAGAWTQFEVLSRAALDEINAAITGVGDQVALARRYATASDDSDIVGGTPGDRGAPFYALKAKGYADAASAAVDTRLHLLDPVEYEACGYLDCDVDADFNVMAGIDDSGAVYIEGIRVAAPAQFVYGGVTVNYLDAVEYEASDLLEVDADADFNILASKELPGAAAVATVDPATLYELVDLSDGANTATYSVSRADGALVKLSPAGSDHTAVAIRPDGNAIYRSTRANGPPGGLFARDLAGLGAEKPVVPYRKIVAPGDSLTYVGGIAANSYWYKLGQRLGWPAVGFGVNGQTARQVASRYGARPVYVSVTGNQIPGTGGVALTAISESPITAGLPNLVIAGTLGGVAGKLSWDQNTGIYTFTRSAAGAVVAVAPGTRFYPTGAGVGTGAIVPYQYDGLLIAWAARNSYYEAESILENLELIIAAQMPLSKRFFVPLCLYSNEDGIGTSNRQVIDRTNGMIKARWPNNWIDFNGPLQNAGNGSAQDLADIAAGYTPTSLRIKDSDGVTVDFLHTNAAGNTVQSDTLFNATVAKGWNL